MQHLLFFRPLVFCLMATTLFAGDDHTFFVESIEFEGLRHVSESILRAELKLKDGEFYSEDQLRGGQYRLDRLAFIWRSEIALRKGSRRGAYRLVITIEETRRFFWLLQPSLIFTREHYLGSNEPGDSEVHLGLSALSLGYRWFFRKSELRLQAPGLLSYVHYDLFGTGTVFNTGFGPTPGEWNPDNSFGRSPFPVENQLADITFSSNALFGYLALSFPVGQDRWLNINGFGSDGDLESLEPLSGAVLEYENTSLSFGNFSLNWTYNTTDHPTFTTSGLVLQVGAARDWLSFDFNESNSAPAYQKWERDMGFFVARRFWELKPDQTFAALFNASWGHNRHESRNALVPSNYSSGKFGLDFLFGRNYLDRRFWKKNRDFRLEARMGYHHNASGLDGVWPESEYGQYEVEFSFTARDNFGTLRFGLQYESTDRGLWP